MLFYVLFVVILCVLHIQRQVLTPQTGGLYTIGPTLVNYRFSYAMEGGTQVSGCSWFTS